MQRDKILFALNRCNYERDKISLDKNLFFLTSSTSSLFFSLFILSRRLLSLSLLVKEEIVLSDESSTKFFRIRILSIFREIKKLRKKNFEYLDIYKISIDVFYLNIKDKKNKLFSLILNKISSKLETRVLKRSRILFNVSYLYKSKFKYKRYYNFNIKSIFLVEISKIDILNLEKIKTRLSSKYYNYLNVFDRLKTNKLSSHRLYNYRLKFVENINKFKLSRSRIYFISSHKLK